MIIDKNYSIDDNLMTNAGFKNFVASFNKEKHKQINFKIDKFLKKHNFRADKLYEEVIEKF